MSGLALMKGDKYKKALVLLLSVFKIKTYVEFLKNLLINTAFNRKSVSLPAWGTDVLKIFFACIDLEQRHLDKMRKSRHTEMLQTIIVSQCGVQRPLCRNLSLS